MNYYGDPLTLPGPRGPDHRFPAIPAGYRLGRDGVHRLDPKRGWVEVSPLPIVITQRDTDIATRTVVLTLAWCRPGHPWRTHEIPRSDARSPGRLVRHSDYDLPVSSLTAREVVGWLVAFENANLDVVAEGRVSSCMGWTGDEPAAASFLWGESCLGADHVTLRAPPGSENLVEGFVEGGSACDWTHQVLRPASRYPWLFAGIYAAVAPVILPLLPDAEAFTVEWAGTTGSGKTTALRVAASVWGHPARIVAPWNTTRVGLETRLFVAGNLPLFLDDTKTCANRGDVSQLIYDIASGHGRSRGSKVGGLATTHRWRTIVLSTGEEPATSFSENGGARARVVCMHGSPFGGSNEETANVVSHLTRAVHQHHGHLGPAVVDLVQREGSRGRLDRRRLSERYWQARTAWTSRATGPVADRVASHFAVLEIAARLVEQAGFSTGADPVETLLHVWDHVAEGFTEVDPCVRALRQVRGWMSAHEGRFFGRAENGARGEWAGAWVRGPSWHEVAVIPTVLTQILGSDFSIEATLKAWDQKGWLHRGTGGHRTRKITVGGDRSRCVCIRRSAFIEIGEDDAVDQRESK